MFNSEILRFCAVTYAIWAPRHRTGTPYGPLHPPAPAPAFYPSEKYYKAAAWCIYRTLGTYSERAEIEYNLYVIYMPNNQPQHFHQAQ